MWNTILLVSCLTLFLIGLYFAIPHLRLVWGLVRDMIEGGYSIEVAHWYHVHSDSCNVYLEVTPPGREAWSCEFRWDHVVRVCWRCRIPPFCDELYFFIRERSRSLVIPREAYGGQELLDELVRRDVLPPAIALRAAASAEGTFCWPPVDKVP